MIDAAVSYGHYFDHLAPIWRALPDELRGDIYAPPTVQGIPNVKSLRDAGKNPERLTLVAGSPDLLRLRGQTGIMIEHGCGQSYGAAPQSARHPAHPGGDRRDKARIFLEPNQQAADRDKARYPSTRVEIIGSPRLAELQTIPRLPRTGNPTVAILTRWSSTVSRESGSAWGHWHKAFQALADSDEYNVIGHAHPRAWEPMRRQFQRMRIEPIQRIEDIIARADCVLFENSSSGFECAALGIPVVVLDCPQYRTGMEHGLRFWDCADIGPRIILPEALPNAITSALNIRPWPGADERLARVFPPIEDPAGYAAALIADEWAHFNGVHVTAR